MRLPYYVVRSNGSSGTVVPIATATNTAGTPIPVGRAPSAIAITPDGTTAYVANFLSGTVTPIDIATNTAGAPIPVGIYPRAIAVTPIVTQAPTITSAARYTATFGVAFSFTMTASGNPFPTITEAGRLPPGVKFSAHSDGMATISGTPGGCPNGVYRMTLTATNQYGTAVQAFTLTVTRLPTCINSLVSNSQWHES